MRHRDAEARPHDRIEPVSRRSREAQGAALFLTSSITRGWLNVKRAELGTCVDGAAYRGTRRAVARSARCEFGEHDAWQSSAFAAVYEGERPHGKPRPHVRQHVTADARARAIRPAHRPQSGTHCKQYFAGLRRGAKIEIESTTSPLFTSPSATNPFKEPGVVNRARGSTQLESHFQEWSD